MKRALLICITALVATLGCRKEKTDPPILPPANSMFIDFSDFNNPSKSGTVSVKGENTSAWEFAVVPVVFWNHIINTMLFVPVAAFQATIDQPPVNVADDTWEWKKSFAIGNSHFQTRLNGRISGNIVNWKMYISLENSYSDFLWFEGTSALDGKSGQWLLYQNSDNPGKLLQIDWEVTSSSSVPHVTYTYIKNDLHYGDFIEYGSLTSSGSPYNSFYSMEYYNEFAGKLYSLDVEWNSLTNNGRVRSSDYLLGEWYCWDSNKVNSTCN